MLKLLLKTRVRYYRNYLKHHLDRITTIEISVIFLVFLLLLLRSPADIGYQLNWLASAEFAAQWAKMFSLFLPIFYLLFEFFAWYTLRPLAEWQIFGVLPFQKRSIANYYLFRYFSKTASLVFFVSIAFFAGTDVYSVGAGLDYCFIGSLTL